MARPLSPQLARVVILSNRHMGYAASYVNSNVSRDLSAGGIDLTFVVYVPDRRIVAATEESFQVTGFVDD